MLLDQSQHAPYQEYILFHLNFYSPLMGVLMMLMVAVEAAHETKLAAVELSKSPSISYVEHSSKIRTETPL